MRSKTLAYVMLILSMLIWGSLALFVNSIGYSSGEIVLVRIVTGLAFLLIVYAFSKNKSGMKAIRKQLPVMLISGAAMGFDWVTLFASYRYVDASIATLCYYIEPLFVVIGSMIFFKQKLSLWRAVGMAAAIAGMVLVTSAVMGGSDPARGVLLALTSGALYAAVALFTKRLKGLSGLEITIGQLIGALIVILPYALISHQGAWRAPEPKELLCMIALGILHTGGALFMYFSAIQQLSVQSVALLSYIDPLSALGFAAVFLGDRLSVSQWIGAALILGGALFGELMGKQSESQEQRQKSTLDRNA